MSALQKLLKEKEREQKQKEFEELGDSGDEIVESKPTGNAFAFLSDSEESSSSSSDSDNEDDGESSSSSSSEEEEEVVEEEEKPKKEVPVKQVSRPASKNGNQRKKSSKKSTGKNEPEASTEASATEKETNLEDEDWVKEFGNSDATETKVDMCLEQLKCNPKFFQAEMEIRKVFGSQVLRMSEEEANTNRGARNRRGNNRRGARLPMKKTQITRAGENWPSMDGRGIKMQFVEVRPDGSKLFEFQYSDDYEKLQSEFRACVGTHDPSAMGYFLRQHPYHADALLQMSQVYLHHGQASDAATLVERCIYTYECGFHHDFDLSSGMCRLDYEHEPNQTFFRAMFRHALSLGKKGCPRTAFELSRFLFSLSPETDPCSALVCMDYFGVRSREYTALSRFVEHVHYGVPPPSLMPNFLYNAALGRFFAEGEKGMKLHRDRVTPDIEYSSSSSSLMLQYAMLHFPDALGILIGRANESESKKPGWVSILSSPHFRMGSDRYGTNPYICKLVTIFVERSALLYKPDKICGWLQMNAEEVVRKIKDGVIPHADLLEIDKRVKRAYKPDEMPQRYKLLMPYEYSDAAVPPLPEDLFVRGPAQRPPGFNYQQ